MPKRLRPFSMVIEKTFVRATLYDEDESPSLII
jgi:hypothetical protein